MLKTLEWTGNALRLIDQTRLPCEITHVDITTPEQMHDAIRRLVVRGRRPSGSRPRSGLTWVCGTVATSARTCARRPVSRHQPSDSREPLLGLEAHSANRHVS